MRFPETWENLSGLICSWSSNQNQFSPTNDQEINSSVYRQTRLGQLLANKNFQLCSTSVYKRWMLKLKNGSKHNYEFTTCTMLLHRNMNFQNAKYFRKQNMNFQFVRNQSSIFESILNSHTAPQRCQPDRLGTLDFLIDSCYCDQDMTISVAG